MSLELSFCLCADKCTFRVYIDEIRVFNTGDRTLQWKADILLPEHVQRRQIFFSPDSNTLVFLVHTFKMSRDLIQLQYNAKTGKKIGETSLKSVPPRVVQCHGDWMLEDDSDGTGLRIHLNNKESGDEIHKGKEIICRVPSYLDWGEEAQIGGTHLFLVTANRGVVILKLPPNVDEDAFSVEDGSS